MFEKFTDRARKVMRLANEEACRFNHEYIGTEHILIGIVKEGSGSAAKLLKSNGIELRAIRVEVEKLVQSAPDIASAKSLPHTPRARNVINYAIEESRALNLNYVGTEHVLLGLLREQEGVAAQVLMALGVKLDKMRSDALQEQQAAPVEPSLDSAGNSQPGTTPIQCRITEVRQRHILARSIEDFEAQIVASRMDGFQIACGSVVISLHPASGSPFSYSNQGAFFALLE